MTFQLHPKLREDTHLITTAADCQVLLMDDARFPWLVLVPQVPDISELYELGEQQQQHTYRAILRISEALARHTQADKMNVAALGNQVPQLHIHIIARYRTDAAWPGPVWGVGQVKRYTATELERTKNALVTILPS
tara:strand:+ start:3414 stop:3821 length:408 start_codon:yes stop_codon:yes gene_type:complete